MGRQNLLKSKSFKVKDKFLKCFDQINKHKRNNNFRKGLHKKVGPSMND